MTIPHGLRIFWYVLAGILATVAVTWITELTEVRTLLGYSDHTPDWFAATVESVVILFIGAIVLTLIYRLLSRIEQLESYITMCAWCRKLRHDDEWVTTDEYLRRHYDTETSHGICPECKAGMDAELAQIKLATAQENQ